MATTKKIDDLPAIAAGRPTDVIPMQRDGVTMKMELGREGINRATALEIAATGSPSFDPTLLPFAGNSPWRLGIAQDAKFAPDSDARNVALNTITDPATGSWLNWYQYSHPIAMATTSDPLAAVTDSFHPAGGTPPGGTWQEYIPATAQIADGTDKHMHVITPDKKDVIEHFSVTRTNSTTYTTTRRHRVSLTGSGLGPQNGTRAYGGSAIGGLIRIWEIDPTHPAYTGRIDHPLAMALRLNQLKYTGNAGLPQFGGIYDENGYGQLLGYVWPASEQDGASATAYSGQIPMGSYFAIKPDVDLTTLGLNTTQGMLLAKAAQDYGVYITDATNAACFYLEESTQGGVRNPAETTFAQALLGSDYAAHDLRIIVGALKVVTSNGPSTPNGGTLGAARRGVKQSSGAAVDISALAPLLTTTAVSTATSGTLAVNTIHPVDATSGNATRTLPTPTKVGQVIRVEKTDSTTNTVAIGGTIRGATGNVILVWQYESLDFVAESLTSWRPGPGHKTKAALDAAYAPLTEPVMAGNSGTAVTLAGVGVNDITLTGNAAITFPSLPASGQAKTIVLVLRQDATGGRTVTWPSTVKWPGAVLPVLSTGAGRVDVFTFTSIDATTWLGFTGGLDIR